MGAETGRFESLPRKQAQLGYFFIIFSKVQVCQCNMGKFEGNSLVGNIVILSRELIQIWGCAVYLDLAFQYGC